MTTRAGASGLLTGLISTIVIYMFFVIEPDVFLGWLEGKSVAIAWVAVAAMAIIFLAGGWLAARWSESRQRWRCVVLGALSGALAGTVIFYLWGAAAAGQAGWFLPEIIFVGVTVSKAELVGAMINQTLTAFLALFIGGGGIGALGGRLACKGRGDRVDVFDKQAPQMAMNVSITAVPAAIFAVVMGAVIFPRLSDRVGVTTLDFPLAVALLLMLISHLALTLVVPHEARQAEHRCGTDEVKMAAFVGIAAAPVLIGLLAWVYPKVFSNFFFLAVLMAGGILSGINIHSLVRVVLPKRASFPVAQDEQQKTEAVLFGTIALSRAPRLVVLCAGCGLAMVLPMYTCALSLLVNLSNMQFDGVVWNLFLKQALVSVGLSAAVVGLLVTIYLVYLNLGRWWRKRGSNKQSRFNINFTR
jgi:hypothetical protein